MAGNAIMGALNWVPKWFHGDADVAENLIDGISKNPECRPGDLAVVNDQQIITDLCAQDIGVRS